MKKISVKNYKGTEFEGEWNEKTYSSKIDGRPDLYRIYISNESVHIEKEELAKIVDDIKAEEKKRKEKDNAAKLEKIEAMLGELSYENKIRLFWELASDPDIIVNILCDLGISGERINIRCREILE